MAQSDISIIVEPVTISAAYFLFILLQLGTNSLYEPRCEKTVVLHMQIKDADKLRGNHEADQRLWFRYTDSTIPLLSKSEISSL